MQRKSTRELRLLFISASDHLDEKGGERLETMIEMRVRVGAKAVRVPP